MIKPEELRINNWVQGPPFTVHGPLNMSHDGIVQITGLFIHYLQIGSIKKDEYTGIPLTEGWLIKAGFETKTNRELNELYNYWNKDADASVDFNIQDKTFHYVAYDNRGCRFTKHIIYVHELQNLHYALKGQELDFN